MQISDYKARRRRGVGRSRVARDDEAFTVTIPFETLTAIAQADSVKGKVSPTTLGFTPEQMAIFKAIEQKRTKGVEK